MKPFSESCEQNKAAILSALKLYFYTVKSVLEIGSGTGQHAVFFAKNFENLRWFSSDQAIYHDGINLWINEARLDNLENPLLLNVDQTQWPEIKVDAVFSANTVHIMGWLSVKNMFSGIEVVLNDNGLFCLYGPFNYNGNYSSDSNAQFDRWLKQRDVNSGVRDYEALDNLASKANLVLIDDIEMPANNRILVWKKSATGSINPI